MRSYSDVMQEDDGSKSKRTGSIGRRSIFKRRSLRQHQRTGSRDSRELTSFSDLSMNSSDNTTTTEDGAQLLYQRVEKIICEWHCNCLEDL